MAIPGIRKEMCIEDIQQIVASYYNLNVEELKVPVVGPPKNIHPSIIAMYLCRKYFSNSQSLVNIAKAFNRKHQNSLYHAEKAVRVEMSINTKFANEIRELEKKIQHQITYNTLHP
jgi:chromosomal replication initiation ATPase DnaA